MALYIDSAYLPEITAAAGTVPVAGVTTNPTILLSARERGQKLSPHQLLKDLLRELTGNIFMQPGDVEEENMYSQAMSYLEIDSSRVILKILMIAVGMRIARRLKQDNHRVAFRAVTSVRQPYRPAKRHTDFVRPPLNG